MEEDGERPRKIIKVEHGDEEKEESQGLVSRIAPTCAVTDTPTANDYESQGNMTATSNTIEKQDDQLLDAVDQPLSKNQLKKLRKQERWEAGRLERKQKRKEKEKERKKRKRAARQEAIKNGEIEADVTKRMRSQTSLQLPISIILDCNYDDLMIDKERVSLSSQLARCYSDNGRSRYRCHLFVSSFNKKLKERFDTVMHKHYQNWKNVVFTEEGYMHAANLARTKMVGTKGGFMEGMFKDKEAKPDEGEIIYLSSDSPNTLTELKPYCTYVVGGLVDKNRHKGVCYRSALENGVKTAKLPIGDYIKMASRQVLTTNHVVEIMIKWLELGDWGEAFQMVIPKRKGGVLIEKNVVQEQEQEREDEQESDSENHEVDDAQEHNEAEITTTEEETAAGAAT
ncbi:tRNA (guanine(9)-N(1))-methyltransferase [Ascosphaera aggregata]|nr:tRNA (guanine(9)-N(1))-methyltransferase [Ascosphaera aggregata]